MDLVVAAVAVVGLAALFFIVSIRIGILLGFRIDRAMEARLAAEEPASNEEVRADE